jgi:hypothetical protein
MAVDPVVGTSEIQVEHTDIALFTGGEPDLVCLEELDSYDERLTSEKPR